MARYVNYDEAAKYYSSDSPCDFAQFLCIREKLLTFESVEIVRCKECRYSFQSLLGELACAFHGGRVTHPDSYCSDGQTNDETRIS